MKNILIIGASGHAKVIIDTVEKQGVYHIVGLIDSFKKKGGKIYDYTILGTEDDIPELLNSKDIFGCIIAIGDNYTRKTLFRKIAELNVAIQFVTAIHPDAVIGKNVTIGDGCVIMAGTIINSDTLIGKQCILNTKCSIDHDANIGDFSSIAPGVTLGGNVLVGMCSAISLGANVIENVQIGKNTVVGAGSLVLKSFDDYQIVYGAPAKTIRSRAASEAYLGLFEINNIANKYELNFVTISNEDDLKTYNAVLQSFKDFNTFYSAEYCNHSPSQKLNYLLFKKNNHPYILLPFFLNEINSHVINKASQYFDITSPYGFSGPLCDKRASGIEKKIFWEYVDNWHQSKGVVSEFIRFNLNHNHIGYSGKLIPTLKNVNGKLTSFSDIWDNFKPKVRNNYRKAEKNQLRAEIFSESITIQTIDLFYDIYIKTMLRNEADQNYFLSQNYFENLIFNDQNKMVIILVYQENRAISTELLIINEDTMYSYLGGTLHEYFELRPNDFLKIEMIKWGLENSINYYALGGGRIDNDSLYNYKKAYFPKDDDVIFYTGRKIINHEIYNKLSNDLVLKNNLLEDVLANPKIYFPIYNHKTDKGEIF